jgi:hypothetical protein
MTGDRSPARLLFAALAAVQGALAAGVLFVSGVWPGWVGLTVLITIVVVVGALRAPYVCAVTVAAGAAVVGIAAGQALAAALLVTYGTAVLAVTRRSHRPAMAMATASVR